MTPEAVSIETLVVFKEESEVQSIARKTGISVSKAEDHFRAFVPALSQLAELSKALSTMDKLSPSAEDAKIASKQRKALVKVRTAASTIKDDRKAGLLAESNLIQHTFNMVKSACEITESEYSEIEKFQEAKLAEERLALIEVRQLLLSPFEVDTSYIPIGDMPEEAFRNLVANSELIFNAKRIAAAKAIEDQHAREAKIELDRIIAEADRLEKERLAKIARKKLEAQLAEKNVESARLALELKDQKDKQRIQDQYNQSVQDAKDRVTNEELAKVQEELRIAQVKAAAEVEVKARAAADQLNAEHKAALAPDKVKLRALYDAINAIVIPEFKTDTAIKIGETVRKVFEGIMTHMMEEGKKMKA